MSQAQVDQQRRADTQASLVQCEACGEHLFSTAIRYTDLGYAICPSCNFEHGP